MIIYVPFLFQINISLTHKIFLHILNFLYLILSIEYLMAKQKRLPLDVKDIVD